MRPVAFCAALLAILVVRCAGAKGRGNFSVPDEDQWQTVRPPKCRTKNPPSITSPGCPHPTTVYVGGLGIRSIQEINDVQSYITLTVASAFNWYDPFALWTLQNQGNLDSLWSPNFASPYAFGKTERNQYAFSYVPYPVPTAEYNMTNMYRMETNTMSISFRAVNSFPSAMKPLPSRWDLRWFPFDKRDVELHFEPNLDFFINGVDLQWALLALPDGGLLNGQDTSDSDQDAMQQLLGGAWVATSGMEWTLRSGEINGAGFIGRFSIRRNYNSWLSNVVIPLLAFVALAIFSLYLPAAGPMAMPRVALTLLAMVSVASMSRIVTDATPAGVTSFLGSFMLSCVLSIVAITAVHVIILSMLNEDKALLQRTNWWLRACTLGTSLLLLLLLPPVVIWSDMGWQGQFPIIVIVFIVEIYAAYKIGQHQPKQDATTPREAEALVEDCPPTPPRGDVVGVSLSTMGTVPEQSIGVTMKP